MWLSHNATSWTTNLLLAFYFIHYPFVVWTATIPSFSERNCLTFLCVNVKQISLCLHYLSVDTPLCFLLGHNWPIVVLILRGLTHLISYLAWTDTPHFLSENSTCCTSFFIFGNVANLFVTIFRISDVIIHLHWVGLFPSVSPIHLVEQVWC